MLLRFWGTRGSIATPGPATVRFGGNTSCVEIVTRAGDRLILDCGTGARALGSHIMAQSSGPVAATVLFSHTHWDHLQGFPFFAPLFVPGSKITICGPDSAHGSLSDVLAGQMEYTYFPVELGQLRADLDYELLGEGVFRIGAATISTQFLNHPAVTLGYRIEADGASLLYLCDHEPFWEPLWSSAEQPGRLESILHHGDRRHAAFMQDADAVIHDAQYTPDEYRTKKNWGHSTYAYATQLAAAANVKRLFLTHHDPAHDDTFLAEIEDRSRDIAAALGSGLRVRCAAEGYEETIENELGAAIDRRLVSARYAVRECGGPILVISQDQDIHSLAKEALVRSGHEPLFATDPETALDTITAATPASVLLDVRATASADGFTILRALRSREATRTLPVLVLTSDSDEESIRSAFQLGATDFVAKPFSPPQLYARVRASWERAQAQASGT